MTTAPRKYPDSLNRYYDDEGWWALAWVDVYELNPSSSDANRYLRTTEAILADMTGDWDHTCGGGIWGSTDLNATSSVESKRSCKAIGGEDGAWRMFPAPQTLEDGGNIFLPGAVVCIFF